ncbi:PIN domain-containing protein [Streptacidiphilus melanogenes]|uniref:PIN domain-containing protein n=1 Tax=Streptacidiphilus melanogenes TaxID=411235 RepID=UPI0005A7EEDE|nr:PIN domain-containing protein [Streptacidiphilus melanogenes]
MSRTFASVVLDCEALSAWVGQDRRMMAKLAVLRESDADLVTCANTIIEATHERTNQSRLHWVLSQLRVEPVTEQCARAAAALLKDAGLHGHKYAIDATVAEVALRQQAPVAVLTSDVDDLSRLCGSRVSVLPV